MLLSLVGAIHATPSSVFWTVCTTDVYDTGVGHIDVDNYFTVFNRRERGSAFLPDVGFEAGIFTLGDIKAEAGVDYIGGASDPLYFNYGMAISEGKLFDCSPSFKVGIFNVGTRHKNYAGYYTYYSYKKNKYGRTDQNIIDVIAGKNLPDWLGGGRFFVGGFSGSRAMGKNRQGFMFAYTKAFCPAIYCDGTEYNKWVFCADYVSGRNTIGGGGFGVYYYFNPYISVLSGPVWFNNQCYYGRWKWTVQIDISFKIFEFCKAG